MTVPTADNNQGRPVQALAREDEDIAHAARLSDENLVDTGAVQKITTHLNEGNSEATATTEDESLVKDFRPHILHQPHKPCPMAMVNRKPRGSKCSASFVRNKYNKLYSTGTRRREQGSTKRRLVERNEKRPTKHIHVRPSSLYYSFLLTNCMDAAKPQHSMHPPSSPQSSMPAEGVSKSRSTSI